MIITPPPIDEHAREMHDMWKGYRETRRTAGTTRSYAETARKVGHEQDVAVLDLWNVFMSEAGWKPAEPLVGSKDVAPNPRFSELMHDGLHLNPEGYRVVFREVMKTIHQHWPDQDPEQLPLVFPIWEHAPTTSQ
ncbi:MAG: isoamyl acetate-hydrolyzing esterase [Caeruleum heppii]|nr:MAG: isoamyl acetate-hydrolyzing esterase [Caeruleum heppii]